MTPPDTVPSNHLTPFEPVPDPNPPIHVPSNPPTENSPLPDPTPPNTHVTPVPDTPPPTTSNTTLVADFYGMKWYRSKNVIDLD